MKEEEKKQTVFFDEDSIKEQMEIILQKDIPVYVSIDTSEPSPFWLIEMTAKLQRQGDRFHAEFDSFSTSMGFGEETISFDFALEHIRSMLIDWDEIENQSSPDELNLPEIYLHDYVGDIDAYLATIAAEKEARKTKPICKCDYCNRNIYERDESYILVQLRPDPNTYGELRLTRTLNLCMQCSYSYSQGATGGKFDMVYRNAFNRDNYA